MKETFEPASSNLAKVDYDSDSQQMVVTFRDGRAWQYDNVPVTVFQGMQHARSAGSYFWRQVRGYYPEQEV